MQKIAFLPAAALLLWQPAHADWTASAQGTARYSDNVGNAEDSDAKRSDETIAGQLALYDVLPLGTAYLLSAGGDLNGQWFDHLTGLRNASIDGGLSLRRRWGLGAFAPWARLSLSVGRTEYDVSLRDYTGYQASVAGGKRLSDRVNLWVDYTYEHREAQASGEDVPGFSTDVFSGNSQSLNATLEYAVVNRVFLDVNLGLRRGDVVSTSEPEYGVYAAARAIAEDPVFGDEWYAYRLLGNSYSLRASLGVQLTEHTLLSLGVQHVRTYADGYFYRTSIPEISWAYQF